MTPVPSLTFALMESTVSKQWGMSSWCSTLFYWLVFVKFANFTRQQLREERATK